MGTYILQFLLKFGQQEHMHRLLTEGMLRMRPLAEFKKPSNDDRDDSYEGIKSVRHLKSDGLFQMRPAGTDEPYKRPRLVKGIAFEHWDTATINNYSLFHFSEQDTKVTPRYSIPEGMRGLGEYYVMIHDPRQFLTTLMDRLTKEGTSYRMGVVNYYEHSHDRNGLWYFDKRKTYGYQKEFRVIVRPPTQGDYDIFFGDLRDIATIHHIDQFKGFDFVWPDPPQT